MGCKNAYLKKLQEEKEAAKRGMMKWTELVIRQYCIDTLQITMHEHFGWGVERIDQLTELWEKTRAEYQEAINPDNKDKSNEADYQQARMDRVFARIVKDTRPVVPFEERYPYIDKIKY